MHTDSGFNLSRHRAFWSTMGAVWSGACLMAILSLASLSAHAQNPSPVAAPSLTGTPRSVPTANGKACKAGYFLNGFLMVNQDDPDPGCSAAKELSQTVPFGLAPSQNLMLVGAGKDMSGNIEADYAMAAGNTAGMNGAIRIITASSYDDPPVIRLGPGVTAMAAPYLPNQGIALENVQLPEADWIGAGGFYRIIIDPRLTSLNLQDVAALLTPISLTPATTPAVTPAPPRTGSGKAEPPVRPKALFGLGIALLVLGAGAVVAARTRQ